MNKYHPGQYVVRKNSRQNNREPEVYMIYNVDPKTDHYILRSPSSFDTCETSISHVETYFELWDSEPDTSHKHTWLNYIGFTDCYEYCRDCGNKRN